MTRRILLPLSLLLPVALVYTAVRTLRQLEEQKEVYLRSRVAAVAARLETLPPGADLEEVFEDEPGLMDAAFVERDSAEGRRLAPLWEGRELFRTEAAAYGSEPVFRAYVPLHAGGALRLARIDIARRSADFLVVHARRNVIIAIASALIVAGLALLAAWSARRASRAEQRQLELEHLAHIGTMAASLAHEIRNPLGTIKGFAQLIGERTDSAGRGLVEPILSETARLENLVRDLLAYGKPPQPVPRPVEWPAVAETIRAHAEAAGRPVKFSADGPAVTFRTDPNLLEQALLNLVRNALEAAETEVRLTLTQDGRANTILVEDDGPGLTEEARRRLFEPFFTTKASGTGLGLAITRKLVESLGGRLEVGPRAQPLPDGRGSVAGKGTAARIELPWNAS